MKSARSSRRAIRIVSECTTAEEFVAAFHPYLERDSLFIATGTPEQPGQAVQFVMTLAGGETVLRGSGLVLESHRDRSNFYGLRGMKLQFDELDDGSRRALAALESRASARQARGAPAPVHAPADVIECLIYDDPDAEPADAAAPAGGAGRRPAPNRVERDEVDDDDVTAVGPPPRPPGAPAGAPHGSASTPRQGTPPQVRPVIGSAAMPISPRHPAPSHAPYGPLPGEQDGAGMPFAVPRPRSEPGPLPEGVAPGETEARGGQPGRAEHAGHDAPLRGPASGPLEPGSVDLSELPTAQLLARPRAGGAHAGQAAAAPHTVGGSGPLLDYDAQPPHPQSVLPVAGSEALSRALHRAQQQAEPGGFPPPGSFLSLPQTQPGLQLGVPAPPMAAEPTEIVWVRRRPGTVRTAAVSGILGALLGLGAGYLLWGEHSAQPRRERPHKVPAAKPASAQRSPAVARPSDVSPGKVQAASSPQPDSLPPSALGADAAVSSSGEPTPAKPVSEPLPD